jgi:hypothetical protein
LSFHTAAKSALVAAATASVLLMPAAAPAAPASAAPKAPATAAAAPVDTFSGTCKHAKRTHILKRYHRGHHTVTLRCGTKTWGWKHIKRRHGWNRTMDRKIAAAIGHGSPNGRGGYSTYTNTCPRFEKFRTIIGTPGGRNDLLTAYNVGRRATGGPSC